MAWTAEVTNDPTRDYDVYVELLEDDEHKARIQKGRHGALELLFYGGDEVSIPLTWLVPVLRQAEQDFSAGESSVQKEE